MHQTAIDFLTSGNVSLEGIFTTPERNRDWFPTLVVCHPHPMLGGNMEHGLVTTICRVADREGFGSLRFNFRGVGRSQGEFIEGDTEQDDIKAALDIVQLMKGSDPTKLALIGYSFGAAAILRGLRKSKAAKSLAFVAPPVAAVRNSRIRGDKRPKLFVVGRDDRVVPSTDLQRVLDDVRKPVRFHEVRGANHSFDEQRDDVAERVVEFMLETLKVDSLS